MTFVDIKVILAFYLTLPKLQNQEIKFKNIIIIINYIIRDGRTST
jgi:hypothetical protein